MAGIVISFYHDFVTEKCNWTEIGFTEISIPNELNTPIFFPLNLWGVDIFKSIDDILFKSLQKIVPLFSTLSWFVIIASIH